MNASIVPTGTGGTQFSGTITSAELPSRRALAAQIAADSGESIREVMGPLGVASKRV